MIKIISDFWCFLMKHFLKNFPVFCCCYSLFITCQFYGIRNAILVFFLGYERMFAENCTVCFFDLEATGLSNYCEIVQVSISGLWDCSGNCLISMFIQMWDSKSYRYYKVIKKVVLSYKVSWCCWSERGFE